MVEMLWQNILLTHSGNLNLWVLLAQLADWWIEKSYPLFDNVGTSDSKRIEGWL